MNQSDNRWGLFATIAVLLSTALQPDQTAFWIIFALLAVGLGIYAITARLHGRIPKRPRILHSHPPRVMGFIRACHKKSARIMEKKHYYRWLLSEDR